MAFAEAAVRISVLAVGYRADAGRRGFANLVHQIAQGIGVISRRTMSNSVRRVGPQTRRLGRAAPTGRVRGAVADDSTDRSAPE